MFLKVLAIVLGVLLLCTIIYFTIINSSKLDRVTQEELDAIGNRVDKEHFTGHGGIGRYYS